MEVKGTRVLVHKVPNIVYQLELPAVGQITGITLTGETLLPTIASNVYTKIAFSVDGSKLLVASNVTGLLGTTYPESGYYLVEYALQAPFDVLTAVQVGSVTRIPSAITGKAVCFGDGTKMWSDDLSDVISQQRISGGVGLISQRHDLSSNLPIYMRVK